MMGETELFESWKKKFGKFLINKKVLVTDN